MAKGGAKVVGCKYLDTKKLYNTRSRTLTAQIIAKNERWLESGRRSGYPAQPLYWVTNSNGLGVR